jgi:adenosine deaminase CECR1
MYVGENREKLVKGVVRIFPTAPPAQSWEPVQKLRQKSGNIALFDQQMYKSFVLSIEDISHPPIWAKFLSSFRHFAGLIADTAIYKTFIKNALLQLIQEDNVQHIEIRDGTHENIILMYKEINEELQKSTPYFTLKIICCAGRDKDRTKVLESAKEALRLRKKYPDIVVGFDLAGEEDGGRSTFYYIDDLLELNRLAEQEQVLLPYYFHGGETNWPFSSYFRPSEIDPIPFNDNLYDVLLLHSKRVGHGLSLIKNPYLMNKFKQAHIAIESCPISNQILGYVKDLRNHPALTYLHEGLAVTISPDDPGIFGYKGVTPDYWEACVAWELDLRALKQLAINSITYSSLSPDKKDDLLKVWEQKWNEFISTTLQNIQ